MIVNGTYIPCEEKNHHEQYYEDMVEYTIAAVLRVSRKASLCTMTQGKLLGIILLMGSVKLARRRRWASRKLRARANKREHCRKARHNL
jgi:hypothetical protein